MSSENPSAGGSEDESLSSSLRPVIDSEPSFEELTSSANLSEDNLSTYSLKELIKDDTVLNEESDKKAAENADKKEASSSSQKSPLFRHKDAREASPFKEALKGFVLSRLTKKPGAIENVNPLDGTDKRTLFSGIKEKIVKKLEDSSVKEPGGSKDISVNGNDVNLSSVKKSECELKSVVANDHSELLLVEQAEECFEEIKITLTSSSGIICDNVPAADPSPPPTGTPRSKTMSNIAATAHQMLRPRMVADKNLSISFSDLQRANELDMDADILEEKNDAPSLHSSTEHPSCSAAPSSSSNDVDRMGSSTTTEMVRPTEGVLQSAKRILKLPRFLENRINTFIWANVLIVVMAVLTYYSLYKHPFFAGLLCGVLLVVLLWLLYTEFINSLLQNDYVSSPTYKTLPSRPFAPPEKKPCSHEGWMNQLNGEYNPDTYKMTDTVSVYVHLQDNKLFLSYPKKNIPRRSMWNEKKINNNPIIREESFFLKGAKILLLPEGLRNSRIWNKRYPLCIILEKEDQKGGSSVDPHTKLEEKDSELNTKPPSSNSSQSGSLSSTPVHVVSNHNVLYLFSRTDREKEEWYWKLYNASKCDEEECGIDLPESDSISVQSLPERSCKGNPTSVKEEESARTASHQHLHKPVLNFDHYMELLIKQELIDAKLQGPHPDSHNHWLNVFLGRLFFDFFVQKKWADRVMERIQYKLDRIKMPQYMQKLVVTDVYLGTCLPQIQNMSEIVVDEKGLWLDLDIHYQGYFQMTLETKLKSLSRAVGERHLGEEAVLVPELTGEAINEEIPEYWDEEEELPDSEASKDESPLHQVSVSTGAKLLHSVEKWVTSSNIAENSFVKRYVGQLMQARLLLTVEISSLCGTLAVNLPPLPTDRLWYGFRTNPQLSLNVFPKVGERHISLLPVVQLIKRKLVQEFQKAVVMPNMDDLVVPIMHSSVYDQ